MVIGVGEGADSLSLELLGELLKSNLPTTSGYLRQAGGTGKSLVAQAGDRVGIRGGNEASATLGIDAGRWPTVSAEWLAIVV
jgi:hypothetical protein